MIGVCEQETGRMQERQANAASYDAEADAVFDRIATRYDLLCDLFSLGLHRLWKQRMAALIAAEPWQIMLDAAAGTGDIALRVRRLPTLAQRSIIVGDLSLAMLRRAERRAGRLACDLQFRRFDAHGMPGVPAASVDLYAISLALKICDRPRVMTEAWRVLKPGGRFIALEASEVAPEWLRTAYLTYLRTCLSTIGWLVTGGDASVYRYLLDGVRRFPAAELLASELRSAGFEDIRFERLSLGIVAIHSAQKPGAPR